MKNFYDTSFGGGGEASNGSRGRGHGLAVPCRPWREPIGGRERGRREEEVKEKEKEKRGGMRPHRSNRQRRE